MNSIGKIGRNSLCPCGSGRKYKNCCLSRSHEIDLCEEHSKSCFPDIDQYAKAAVHLLCKYRIEDAAKAVFCLNAWPNNRSVIKTACALNRALEMVNRFGDKRIDGYKDFCELAQRLMNAYPVTEMDDYIINDFGQAKIWINKKYYPIILGNGYSQVYSALHCLSYLSKLLEQEQMLEDALEYWELIHEKLKDSIRRNESYERMFECPEEDFFIAVTKAYPEIVDKIPSSIFQILSDTTLAIERRHFIARDKIKIPLFNTSLLIDVYSYMLKRSSPLQKCEHVNFAIFESLSTQYIDSGDLLIIFPAGRLKKDGKPDKAMYVFTAMQSNRVLIAINRDMFTEEELRDELQQMTMLHETNQLSIFERRTRENEEGFRCYHVPEQIEIHTIIFDSFTDITETYFRSGEKEKNCFNCSALDLLYFLLLADSIQEIDDFITNKGQDDVKKVLMFGGISGVFINWKQMGHVLSQGAIPYDLVNFDSNSEDMYILERFENEYAGFPFEQNHPMFTTPFGWTVEPQVQGFYALTDKKAPLFGGFGKKLDCGSFIFFAHNAEILDGEFFTEQSALPYLVADDICLRATYRYQDAFKLLHIIEGYFIELIVLPPETARERMKFDTFDKLQNRYVCSEVYIDEKNIIIRYVINSDILIKDIESAETRRVECEFFCQLFEPLSKFDKLGYLDFCFAVMRDADKPKQVGVSNLSINYYLSSGICPYIYNNHFFPEIHKRIAQICYTAMILKGTYYGKDATATIRQMQQAIIQDFENEVAQVDKKLLHYQLLSFYASELHDTYMNQARYDQFENVDEKTRDEIRERILILREKSRSFLQAIQLLMETNLSVAHCGNLTPSIDVIDRLLAYSERLLELLRAADVCYWCGSANDIELQIDQQYLVYVKQNEEIEESVANTKRRIYRNEDYCIRCDEKDKEYFQKATIAFEVDTGVSFQILIDMLDYLSSGFQQGSEWHEIVWNVFAPTYNEILDSFLVWAPDAGYDREAVKDVLDFIIINDEKIRFRHGIEQDYIPINEREQRDNRVDVDLAPWNRASYNVRKKRKKTNKGAERRWQERTTQLNRSSSSCGR